MRWFHVAGAIFACAILENSCAKYKPPTLNPVESEARFRSRNLNDPGLALAPGKLDLASLTKIAIYFSPDLEVARARAASASAALITARQRVNPSLTAEGGYNRTPESVATYAVSPAFTIETAGKRGFRIMEAEKLAEAARIGVYETEWQVRSHVRAAFAGFCFARQKLAQLQSENAIRAEIVRMLETRVAMGESSRPELTAARADQAALTVNLRNAESDAAQAFATLAASTGLPASALEGQSIDTAALDTPPAPESLPLLRIQKAGLLHRADVRRSLTEYAAADSRLRLELANQYPNITLSPSYAFQEGFPSYTLGSVIDSLPLFHRHEGPIAEAEAARNQLEAQFKALQAQAIAETETASRQYRGAYEEWLAARDVLERIAQQRELSVTAGLKAGESDRLDLATARLASLTASRARLDALIRAQTALGALQDAVQSSLPELAN